MNADNINEVNWIKCNSIDFNWINFNWINFVMGLDHVPVNPPKEWMLITWMKLIGLDVIELTFLNSFRPSTA